MSKGKWRKGPPPKTASTLGEHDHDMLDGSVIIDAREHARKLCGLVPYSHDDVKGVASAAMIYRLLSVVGRLMACKSVTRYREIVYERDALRRELAACRREMRRWGLEYPGGGEKQQELPFSMGAEA